MLETYEKPLKFWLEIPFTEKMFQNWYLRHVTESIWSFKQGFLISFKSIFKTKLRNFCNLIGPLLRGLRFERGHCRRVVADIDPGLEDVLAQFRANVIVSPTDKDKDLLSYTRTRIIRYKRHLYIGQRLRPDR